MEGHTTGSLYPVRHTPGYPQTLMAHANYKLTLQYFNLSLGLRKENHTIIIIIIILAGNSGGYYINYM